MKNISYLKKLSLFLEYRKAISKLERRLEQNFNARVDKASRIYTVLNIPQELIEEPYNLRKADIDNLANTYIKDYSNQLSRFLNQNGLMELYDFYKVEKVDKYSYLLIFGFSLFDSALFLRNLYWIFTPIVVVTISILLFVFFSI